MSSVIDGMLLGLEKTLTLFYIGDEFDIKNEVNFNLLLLVLVS